MQGTDPLLFGIGYYEAVASAGIEGASMAGGTEVVFYGQGMSMTPSDMSAIYSNAGMGGQMQGGPPQPQDIAFSSHTDGGKLKYTTSSMMQLHGRQFDDFNQFDSITYDLSLIQFDEMTQALATLKCTNPLVCQIKLSRAYTPQLYSLAPPVIYSGSPISFWIDPRSTQSKKSTLLPEFPFVEVRINGYGVDFEGFIEEDTYLPTYTKSQLRGLMGAITPNMSASILFRYRAGHAYQQDATMLRCDYTNTTCYKAKAVGVINSIDATEGFTSGGQLITVKGYGFNSANIQAVIDGVPCQVQSKDLYKFTCQTGVKAAPSTVGQYVGQHGLRRKLYNTTYDLTWNLLSTSTDFTEMLSMDLEAPVNVKSSGYGNNYQGYFKAPATASYRFYMSCDDYCQLYFSNANMDPSKKALILNIGWNTAYRNYFTVDGKRISAWLNLTKDEYYFIELRHIQGSGGDHVTVSVEIQDPTLVSGHQHSMREIQRLIIDQTIVREQTQVTIINPDGGQFILNMINPVDSTIWASKSMSTNCSAWDMQLAIQSYYNQVLSAAISIVKVQYDVNDTVTTTASLSVKNIFTISVLKSLPSASLNQITVQKVTTKSSIAVILPRNLQLSNLPISGSFAIKCALNGVDTWNTTIDMTWSNSTSQISSAIIKACPNYREKFDIWEGAQYNYIQDGRDLLIRFTGLNQDIPQMEILSSIVEPLVANTLNLSSTTFVPYSSQNLFYEPVPFEFLYTAELTPQVIVSMDGIEAVCDSLDCGYSYISSTSQIDSFTLSENTLTIIGSAFPSSLQSVTFSKEPCTNIEQPDSQTIKCTVTSVAGSWQPVVVGAMGIIPVSTTDVIQVPLTITTLVPAVSLNPFGGQILTISGSNLPQTTIDGTTLKITISDSSECLILSTSSTQITCMTDKFTVGATSAVITITVNGNIDASLSITLSSGPAVASAISPNSVSPVLKNILTLPITGFTGTLIPSDLEVSVVSQTNSSNIRYINIIEVGNTNGNQYIKVKFPGSDSGIYNVFVRSKTIGRFDTTGITIQTVGVVTAYSPNQGSVNGGTLITVTGYHFSTDIQDNPIRIGYTDCMVESSTVTEIKCRTMARMEDTSGTDDFMVFLRTSEQAACAVSPCTFEWVMDGIATVVTSSVIFDSTVNDYVLTLTGTNFGASTTNSEILIDNSVQTILSASDTEIKVQIVNMQDMMTMNIDAYLPIGVPNGMEDLKYTTGITLTPVFLSVTPQIGSLAGSMIIASVKGVGPSTMEVTLVTQAGVDICASVSIPSYGVVQCKTKPLLVIPAASPLSVKVGMTIQECLDTSSNYCSYETSTSMPSITAVTKSDDLTTLNIDGTGFLSATDFNGVLTYAGITATSVTLNSDTSATAIFATGIPVQQTALKPEMYFVSTTSSVTHWSTVTATVINAKTVTSIDQTVTCSFAGGCSLSISQVGLLSNLQNPDFKLDSILVCGEVCTLNQAESTIATTKCSLPALATTYSIGQYTIVGESYLTGNTFSSIAAQTYSLFDGSLQNGWTSATANCYFGMSFKVGYIGVLNEVKYFMNRFIKTTYIGNLQFQGSMDGITYTTVFTVGQEIHEGWNYQNFDNGTQLKYRFYRFFGKATGSCIVGEVSFRGYEAIDDTSSTYTCQTQLVLNGAVQSLTGTVVYQADITPLLTSISPRFGTVVGGEEVTFSGVNFSSDKSLYSVLIDGKSCAVTSATTTQIKCTTSKRPGIHEITSLEITIAGMGSVATQGLLFRYVNYWSDTITWGGEFAPIDGDMVYIPKGLHLLVDVDSTAILSAVVVEGSLIFPPNADPNHLRTFDAHYVMIKGGYFEAGTEQFPYTSQLLITMHSNRQSPEMPIFGNKVIAMYNGVLDFHGVPRFPTWTMLDTTSDIGSSTITLIKQVDWVAGERIVIAPTGYYNTEAEERTILSIDNTNPQKPVITLDRALEFKHFAGIQNFGTDFIEMRAEVGLLTRNVIYRGDPETSADNEYGAHIMVHAEGSENLIARIEYIELFNVGQAFQLGRYPIHFHLIGVVHSSYIRGNAIHQSYNRACTIHGVHYLRVTENVAYNTKGHTFFIEDAAETHNLLENNLAILTKKSWSLLNSDQTPASFWITHPDNILRGNHAAGADNYGFWFDTKPNPTGPSYDPNICPENSPLGEFSNNVAHSNGRYGLRLFHKLKPRTFPCSPIVEDLKNITDPYWKNPLITARFTNFTSFKNQRNGAIALDMGDVRLENFKVADNLLAGIEFELTDTLRTGYCQINGALVIGRSDNADALTNNTDSQGVVGPRTEGFSVNNVKFYNFDIAGKSAIGSCSHCFSPPATDSGARTVNFSNIYFDSSVTIKIRYEIPHRDIFYDIDGSLTGLGAGSWATPYWKHNDHPGECIKDLQIYDGLLCYPSVQIRRIVFEKYSPNIFAMMDLKILQWDDNIVSAMSNVTKNAYLLSKDNYSIAPFRPKTNPVNAWAMPYVTGHQYKLHWQYGLDFTQFQVTLSNLWQVNDKDVKFVFNFTDVRAKVDFLTGKDNIKNETLLSFSNAVLQTGANIVYNDTATREIHLLINGKNSTRNPLVMKAYRCVGSCLPPVTTVQIESTIRYWSNITSWVSGKVPIAGEDVVIPPGQNFIFDLDVSPIYNYVQINGRVTFLDGAPSLHLQAKYVFVRAGQLIIGNLTNPFLGQARITLFGEKNNQQIVYDNAIEAGNKILANTGLLQMYGRPRISRSRLLKTANKGDTSIQVESGLSWEVNDKIGLAPTAVNWFELDYAIIKTYDNVTGITTLDRTLDHYHYGSALSTGDQYSGVDMRGEVMLLTRNVRIVGNDTEAWGCQVVTSDFIEGNGEKRYGKTVLDNVEIYNCSQYDTYKAALRFESNGGDYSIVSNSAIHHGLGMGIEFMLSSNTTFLNNNVFDFVKYGINVDTSKNVTIDGNWVVAIFSRHLKLQSVGDPILGILGCANYLNDVCSEIHILNNVMAGVEAAAGADTSAYSVMPNDCGDTKNVVFKNNVAHSIDGYGAIIFRNGTSDSQLDCIEASWFTAYKCSLAGIVSNQVTKKVIFHDMILIDNGHGAIPMIGQEGEDLWAMMNDITFYGETEARDCSRQGVCLQNSEPGCIDRTAIMISAFADHSKPAIIRASSSWPQFKIKADASFGGNILYDNLKFINFKSETSWCGFTQKLFRINHYAPDYTPRVKLTNTKFQNVDQDTLAYIFTPPMEWAILDDCGQFPCTGPNNVLIWFETSTYSGSIMPLKATPNFQIISGNTESSGGFSKCSRVNSWNGYYCTNDNLAIILFESLDSDKLTRIISPITVTSLNITTRNVLNTFMDHQWDGFYTSMKRLSRWASILQGGNAMFYDINYKGTPPQKQRFSLRADYTSVVIRIKYPKAGVYQLKDVSGNLIKGNAWDYNIQEPGLIKGNNGGSCGENRYNGVINVLEFYLNRGCMINIELIDSIQANVRLNWTMSEFFADGGTTKFVDRIAASLGIKAANIKVVSVYMGSVIVQFAVIEDSTKSLSQNGGMDSIQTTLTTLLVTKAINLGAPILNSQVAAAKTRTVSSTTTSATNTQTTGIPTTGTTVITPVVTPPTPTVQPVVIVNSTVIQVQQQQGGSSTVMIAVICSIIGVIVVGSAISYFLYKKFNRGTSPVSDKSSKEVEQSSKQSVQNITPNVVGDDMYQDQYHPSAAFDIFGRGDKFMQKANEADDLDEDQDSPVDTEGEQQVRTHARERQLRDSTPLHQSFQSPNRDDLSIRKIDEETGSKVLAN